MGKSLFEYGTYIRVPAERTHDFYCALQRISSRCSDRATAYKEINEALVELLGEHDIQVWVDRHLRHVDNNKRVDV